MKKQIQDAIKLKRILVDAQAVMETLETENMGKRIGDDTSMSGDALKGYNMWGDIQSEAGGDLADALYEVEKALTNAEEYLVDAGMSNAYINELFEGI